MGLKKIAIISAYDEWSEVYSAAFKAKVEELGAKVSIHEVVNLDTSDFKTVITKIKNAKAEVVLGALFSGALVSWIKQSRELGYAGTLLSGDGISENEIQEAGLNNSEGLYASQIWVTDPTLAKLYQEKFGQKSDGLNLSFVSIGFDTLKCLSALKHVLERQGLDFNSETVRSGLLDFKCAGSNGEFSISRDRLSNKREKIVVVKAGKFNLVD